MWLPFGVVGRLGARIRQLDNVYRRTRRGNFGVDMGRPIVTNGNFVALVCKDA